MENKNKKQLRILIANGGSKFNAEGGSELHAGSQCSKKSYKDAKKTAPVGSFPMGASPYGVVDMAGNVW